MEIYSPHYDYSLIKKEDIELSKALSVSKTKDTSNLKPEDIPNIPFEEDGHFWRIQLIKELDSDTLRYWVPTDFEDADWMALQMLLTSRIMSFFKPFDTFEFFEKEQAFAEITQENFAGFLLCELPEDKMPEEAKGRLLSSNMNSIFDFEGLFVLGCQETEEFDKRLKWILFDTTEEAFAFGDRIIDYLNTFKK